VTMHDGPRQRSNSNVFMSHEFARNRLFLCGNRLFEYWDLDTGRLFLNGETSSDSASILVKAVSDDIVVICEAELIRVYRIGRKGPLSIFCSDSDFTNEWVCLMVVYARHFFVVISSHSSYSADRYRREKYSFC